MTGRAATVTRYSVSDVNSQPENQPAKPSLITIKAKVSNNKISYLLDTFICSEVVPNKDGSITASFTVPDEPWLQDLLLGFGPDLKILSPKSARERIVKLARDVLKNYTTR